MWDFKCQIQILPLINVHHRRKFIGSSSNIQPTLPSIGISKLVTNNHLGATNSIKTGCVLCYKEKTGHGTRQYVCIIIHHIVFHFPSDLLTVPHRYTFCSSFPTIISQHVLSVSFLCRFTSYFVGVLTV